jgi:GAF domain-containing protein
MPLIGALFVTEGLVTQEQLEACLLLQAQDHPDAPLGQIMLRCGYITEADLSRTLGLQRDLKTSIIDTIDARVPVTIDLNALILCPDRDQQISSILRRLGVMALSMNDWAHLRAAWEEHQPDLIVIDPALMDESTRLPKQLTTSILFLPLIRPEARRPARLPEWAVAVLLHSVTQVRAQRRQHKALEHLQECEFDLNAIAAMCRSITAVRSAAEAANQLMITIRNLFGIEAGTLYRLDREKDQLVFEVVFGPMQEELYHQRLPTDRGIAGWVVRNREPLIIPDVRRDPRFEGMFDNQTGFQTRSVLCIPLIAMGEICGVLQLINKLGGEFDDRDLLLLRILGALAAPALSSFPLERNMNFPGRLLAGAITHYTNLPGR